MVYSRFGVKVIDIRFYDPDTGKCEILLEGDENHENEWLEYSIISLQADNGFPEILQMIEESKE
jgi:hypothetical protein